MARVDYPRQLIADSGLPVNPGLYHAAEEYLARTRRGRRYGLIAGVLAGVSLPFLLPGQGALVYPLIAVGYLLGLLASEVVHPMPDRPAMRHAGLSQRRAGDLLPRWARAAYWAVAVPILAAPLLSLAFHRAAGRSSVVITGYSCWSRAPAFPIQMLSVAAILGTTGVALTELTLHRLARRARPADDPGQARLDDVTRRLSARAAAAGATALGLLLIAVVSFALSRTATSAVCPPYPPAGPLPAAYPAAVGLAPWMGALGLTSGLAALAIAGLSGWRARPRSAFAAADAIARADAT